MAHTGNPIGQTIDALGVRSTPLPEGHMVSDAIVLMRVISDTGETYISQVWSEGMDWISRRGLLEAALDTERIPPRNREA